MCGIVGYAGHRRADGVLLQGLKKLEYRGYDSAGIAVCSAGEIFCEKKKGRVGELQAIVEAAALDGHVGIGHTRWATHGAPSDVNSHPHLNGSRRFALVHNGIIENYAALKDALLAKGYRFRSETDSEVLAHMLEACDCESLLETLVQVLAKIQGSYAIAVLDREHPEEIFVARKASPLVIGLGDGENFIASDIPAVLEYTKNMYILEDGEIASVQAQGVTVYDAKGQTVDKKVYQVHWDATQADKGGFADYMRKEIYEQPNALRKMLDAYCKDDKITLPFQFTRKALQEIKQITIVGCGTASYAGRVGEYILEEITGIPVKVEVGSEYRYKRSILDASNLIIILSQSGETADSLASMREAKAHGAKLIGVTNVIGSTLSRELEHVIHTMAGPEIAVASTKAFTSQILALYLIGLFLAESTKTISESQYQAYISKLRGIPEKVEEILRREREIQSIAEEFYAYEDMFFIGRLWDYPIALEGSHKLKEISYIHAEAYEAGELKHGALALVTSETPVICLSSIAAIADKMASNIMEVKARNAQMIHVRSEAVPPAPGCKREFLLPQEEDLFTPILAVVPLQLFSYFTAKYRGCDVDKPRNLAKSVTVE